MVTNYQRAAGFERELVNTLKIHDFAFAQRTAGSHSPVDVIASGNISGFTPILFFQCKSTQKYRLMTRIEVLEILDELNRVPGAFCRRFLIEKTNLTPNCCVYRISYMVFPFLLGRKKESLELEQYEATKLSDLIEQIKIVIKRR